jgi:hypothetical protein
MEIRIDRHVVSSTCGISPARAPYLHPRVERDDASNFCAPPRRTDKDVPVSRRYAKDETLAGSRCCRGDLPHVIDVLVRACRDVMKGVEAAGAMDVRTTLGVMIEGRLVAAIWSHTSGDVVRHVPAPHAMPRRSEPSARGDMPPTKAADLSDDTLDSVEGHAGTGCRTGSGCVGSGVVG